MANKNLEDLEIGDILLVRAQREGMPYLPVFPSRRGDLTLNISDGIMLNCLGLKELQPGASFYEMEIVTGKDSGDIVLVSRTLQRYLEKIPSKKRIR